MSTQIKALQCVLLSIACLIPGIRTFGQSTNLKKKVDQKSGLAFIQLPKGEYPALAALPQAASAKSDSSEMIDIGPLWMGETDVTVAAYAKCAAAGVCNASVKQREENELVERCSWNNGLSRHPINCVSWKESAQFCGWIDGRLPTATEWEYAATSGHKGKSYPWGEAPVDAQHANYCDVNCTKALAVMPGDGKSLDRWEKAGLIDKNQNDGWAVTSPAGNYAAGATEWGLLDMAGNVWQWTSTAAGDGMKEVRGGSWDNAPASLRTDRRLAWPEKATDSGMGFRCVKDSV